MTNLKMRPFRHTVTINNKTYTYRIKPINKEVVFFECPAGKIAQEFLIEDIPALLIDLPALILAQKEYEQRQEMIRFRVSSEDKKKIEQRAVKAGYSTISAFLRALALGGSV